MSPPRSGARRLLTLGVLAAIVSAACLAALVVPGSADTTSTSEPVAATEPYAGQRTPTEGPQSADPEVRHRTDVDIIGGLLIGAPIANGDFADPFALRSGTSVYVYATNTTTANIPVIQLVDGNESSANYLGDALPQLPSWTTKGFQWAPSVWAKGDGTFVLHYSTPDDAAGGRQCISAATGTNPAGPFTDTSSAPMVCPLDQGGAIDPSIFVDTAAEPDVPYLLWKADGNCCGLPTKIYSQELAADGLSTVGPPNELVADDQGWEKGVVEGPSMVLDQGTYYLFYSANDWDSANYAIGVATCSSITGPCTKPDDEPWERSSRLSQGPGGQEFFNSTGGVWMVRHGWLPGQAGTPDGQRRLYLDLLEFRGSGELPTRVGADYIERALLPYVLGLGAVVVALGLGAWWLVRSRRRRAA